MGAKNGDTERGLGSDRKEKAMFGDVIRKCQYHIGSGAWTGHHASNYHHSLQLTSRCEVQRQSILLFLFMNCLIGKKSTHCY